MTSVRVRENEPFEAALRRFKRTIEKTGLLTELRAREFYEKPTSERKRKKAAAVKRHYKRLRSQQLPPKLYGPTALSGARRTRRGRDSHSADRGEAIRPFCMDRDERPDEPAEGPHHRRHEGRDARESDGARAQIDARDAPRGESGIGHRHG